MNPTSTDPTAPPPQPPQPPRSSFSCDRHPAEQFTGFCPTCLCERLTTLDQSSSNTPSSSRRPSSASAAAAIKSLFSSTAKSSHFPPPPAPPPKPSKPASFIPELRRTQSFSASKNEALGLCFEPQRKSCDVRARSTLWSLFTLDNGNNKSSSFASSSHQNPQNSKRIDENVEDGIVHDEVNDEIRDVEDSQSVDIQVNSGEIVEEEEEEAVTVVSSLKPMKDHMNLDTQGKKNSGGGIWAAASVFSKKWHKWRQKQKMKKQNNGDKFTALPVEKPISRQYRETQSEIADYGFGRRSCDTDPRFSLDAGRISFDDPRYSFEEPRASWDGYLIGRNFPRMAPMVSVMEDGPSRSDMQIPVLLTNNANEEVVPGGSIQTKEYYTDSSSRRRKSLDRSNSIRKTAASVVAEIDELKMASNAKVSPTTADYFHGAKVVGERDLRDDCSETNISMVGSGERKELKKSRRWSWRIWGFIHRRSGNKDEDEVDKYNGVGVERSLSESWNGDVRGGFSRNMLRSNSSVSMRKSSVEMNGHVHGKKKKKKGEIVLEKNRSARYSPPTNNVDNGLLRFYLTPMSSSRRGGGGIGKMKPNNSNSIARSVLKMY